MKFTYVALCAAGVAVGGLAGWLAGRQGMMLQAESGSGPARSQGAGLEAEAGHDHEAEAGHEAEAEAGHDHEAEAGHEAETEAGHDHKAEAAVAIPAPENVRRNLGIRFVQAERRQVQQTLRTAGRFEWRPEAKRSYGLSLPGFVTPKVVPMETVAAGQVLFTFRSPELPRLDQAVTTAQADLAAAEAAAGLMRKRLESLKQAGSRNATLEFDLGLKEQEILRLQTAVATATQLRAAGIAGTVLDPATGELQVSAAAPGRVERLAVIPGAWGEAGTEVVTVVNPAGLRFAAVVSLADAASVADGQPGRIVPTQGSGISLEDEATGKIAVGLEADPASRLLSVFLVPARLPGWARPGIPAFLEIQTGSGGGTIAVPRSAIVRDGDTSVVFVRNPKNPDEILRSVVETGADDGRWVAVSGIDEGAEVVVEGAYELKLATAAQPKKAGHFHADGVFHEGKHE